MVNRPSKMKCFTLKLHAKEHTQINFRCSRQKNGFGSSKMRYLMSSYPIWLIIFYLNACACTSEPYPIDQVMTNVGKRAKKEHGTGVHITIIDCQTY